MSNKDNEFSAALAAGTALCGMREYNGVPYAVVPDGYRADTFRELLPTPQRHTGKTVLHDADSFVRFVNAFKGGKGIQPRLYFQQDPAPSFTAVLNDSSAESTAWRDFRAVYNAPLSSEWLAWTAVDGKPMAQEDFALFIERNLLDIHSPEPAHLLELAQTFQAKKAVNFASGTRMNNGEVQFVFEETIQAKAGEKGQIKVPEQIEIVIPVFDGSVVADRITAKFRYRIKDAKLVMWFEMERPHKVLEAAISDLRKQIEEHTGLAAFKGVPA